MTDPIPLDLSLERARPVLAVVITVALTALVYVALVDLPSSEEGDCFSNEIVLMFWAVVSSLAAGCACAAYLAAIHAARAAYVLLTAALGPLAGATYWLGVTANACAHPGSALAIAVIGLVSGSPGVAGGALAGRGLREQ